MGRRTSSTRAQALRRAQQAKQERDAHRLAREQKLESVLADFFEHTERAVALREQAQTRAAKLLDDAHAAAREPERLATAAVRTLAELGETRAAIAELTGLTPTQVREVLAVVDVPGQSGLLGPERVGAAPKGHDVGGNADRAPQLVEADTRPGQDRVGAGGDQALAGDGEGEGGHAPVAAWEGTGRVWLAAVDSEPAGRSAEVVWR